MQVITIAARKGGVGKTTLATHFSVIAAADNRPSAAARHGPSAQLWRGGGAFASGDTPALVECDARELPKIVPTARKPRESTTCIVDTPPHAEGSIGDAMRVSDIVLVPTRPGPFDLAGVAATLDLAKRVGRPALAVINHAPPRTGPNEPSIVTEARETLKHMGADVAETVIAQRVALSHAIISGSTVNEFEPDGRAAAEIAALWREVQSKLRT